MANRTDEETVQAIAALRRLRFTAAEIAEVLDRPLSTISGILTRIGMGKLGRLGLERAERQRRSRPWWVVRRAGRTEGRGSGREREGDGGAGAGRVVSPDAAAVQLDDRAADREAKARATLLA